MEWKRFNEGKHANEIMNHGMIIMLYLLYITYALITMTHATMDITQNRRHSPFTCETLVSLNFINQSQLQNQYYACLYSIGDQI